MERRVDPFILAVMVGHFNSIVRQMSVTMARTARSTVFKLFKDFSDGIFDKAPRLIAQGEDELPIHIGAAVVTGQKVASYFKNDVYPGDIILHNDPASGGTHMQDVTMLRPIFYKDELMFWALCRAHMSDIGGMTPGGHQPQAEEIYQEGIRVPPTKLYEKGKERRDVINLFLANVRFPEVMEADLMALKATSAIAERELLKVVEKYGRAMVEASIEDIFDIAERRMRTFISGITDGVYDGSCMLHDDGRGSGEQEIKATVSVKGDELRVDLNSPKQLKNYTNCYEANSTAMVYLGILSHMKVELPLNAGSYRPITVNLGPKGTITNAAVPAATSLSTSIANSEIQAAVRVAMSKSIPENAHADWGHTTINHVNGVDPRSDKPYTLWFAATNMGGAGAVRGVDGWSALSSPPSAGAAYYLTIEQFEYEFPLLLLSADFRTDSGGAGKWRGGLAADLEFTPLNNAVNFLALGVGDKFPACSVGGGKSRLVKEKLHRRYLIRKGRVKRIKPHSIINVQHGESVHISPQGGGGVGDAFERDPEMVRMDVMNELVSIHGAEEDYGVVIDPETLHINSEETKKRREK